jgi:hypothetical protein
MAWKDHAPAWPVELAREQHPELPWLLPSLALCTSVRETSRAHWHFELSLQLHDKREGELVLDI